MSTKKTFHILLSCLLLTACADPTGSSGVISLNIPVPVARLDDARQQGLPAVLRNGTTTDLLFVACGDVPQIVVERFLDGAWQASAVPCPTGSHLTLAPLAAGAFYSSNLRVSAPGRYRARVRGGTIIDDLSIAQGMVLSSAPFEVK